MSQGEFVGVDGCRGGWFSVGLDRDGGLGSHRVFGSFAELLEHNADADLVLVDMPIGLPEGSGGRACDKEARGQAETLREVRAYSRRRRSTGGAGGSGLPSTTTLLPMPNARSPEAPHQADLQHSAQDRSSGRCPALPGRGCSAASAGGAPRGVFLGVEPSWRYLHLQSYLHEPQQEEIRRGGRAYSRS